MFLKVVSIRFSRFTKNFDQSEFDQSDQRKFERVTLKIYVFLNFVVNLENRIYAYHAFYHGQ